MLRRSFIRRAALCLALPAAQLMAMFKAPIRRPERFGHNVEPQTDVTMVDDYISYYVPGPLPAGTIFGPRYKVMFHENEEQTPEPVKETIDEFCARRFEELREDLRLKLYGGRIGYQAWLVDADRSEF